MAFLKFYTESETTKEMDAELESYNSLNKGLTIRYFTFLSFLISVKFFHNPEINT